MCRVFVFIIIFFCAYCVADESLFNIPEDWVDPGDMFSYDPATKTNNYPKKGSKVESDKPPFALQDEYDQNENIDKHKIISYSNIEVQPPKNVCEHPFLRRYVAVLMNKLHGLVAIDDSSTVLEMKLRLSPEDLQKLMLFSEKCSGSPQDIAHVLELIMVDVTIPQQRPLLERWFHMKANDVVIIAILLLVVTVFLTMETITSISLWRQFLRFLFLSLLCTFVWTYIHEYQKVKNEAISDMTNVPERCVDKFHEETFFESISKSVMPFVSVGSDVCAKYHDNFGVNPLVKVPPTKIIAITFARFLFEPLEHFGTSFGRLVRNTFREVPVTLWIPTILLLAIFLLFALAFLTVYLGYNWSFTLPFWTGFQIGPSVGASNNNTNSEEVLYLRDANKKLMEQIEHQQEQERLKIQNPPNSNLHSVEDVPPYPIHDRGDNVISAMTIRKRLQKVPSAPPEVPYPCYDNMPFPSTTTSVATDDDDSPPIGFEHIHVEELQEDDTVDIKPSKL